MNCYVKITALVYELFLLSKRQLRCLKTVLKTRCIAVLPVGLSDWWAPAHSNNHEEDYPHETSPSLRARYICSPGFAEPFISYLCTGSYGRDNWYREGCQWLSNSRCDRDYFGRR